MFFTIAPTEAPFHRHSRFKEETPAGEHHYFYVEFENNLCISSNRVNDKVDAITGFLAWWPEPHSDVKPHPPTHTATTARQFARQIDWCSRWFRKLLKNKYLIMECSLKCVLPRPTTAISFHHSRPRLATAWRTFPRRNPDQFWLKGFHSSGYFSIICGCPCNDRKRPFHIEDNDKINVELHLLRIIWFVGLDHFIIKSNHILQLFELLILWSDWAHWNYKIHCWDRFRL